METGLRPKTVIDKSSKTQQKLSSSKPRRNNKPNREKTDRRILHKSTSERDKIGETYQKTTTVVDKSVSSPQQLIPICTHKRVKTPPTTTCTTNIATTVQTPQKPTTKSGIKPQPNTLDMDKPEIGHQTPTNDIDKPVTSSQRLANDIAASAATTTSADGVTTAVTPADDPDTATAAPIATESDSILTATSPLVLAYMDLSIRVGIGRGRRVRPADQTFVGRSSAFGVTSELKVSGADY